MPALLGVLVALTYGAADFCGGFATKRLKVKWVLFVSQGLSLLVVVAVVAVRAEPLPAGRDVVLGVVAGFFGLMGISFQYRALALGPMRVVAPIAAVGSAAVPVATGLLSGERPTRLASVGLVIAVGAVVTLTRAESDGEVPLRDRPWWRGGPMLGAAAGLCFGTFFALFGAVDPSSGAWPVLFDRVVSVGLLAIVVVIAPRGRPSINRGGWVLLATCGGLDVTAHVLYVFAGHNGLTSEIAVLSSLYPATTVMLAVVVTRERLRLAHIVGLFAALVGVACIAMGSG